MNDSKAELVERFAVSDVFLEKDADLTYVYILGGLIISIVLICGFYIFVRYRTVN